MYTYQQRGLLKKTLAHSSRRCTQRPDSFPHSDSMVNCSTGFLMGTQMLPPCDYQKFVESGEFARDKIQFLHESGLGNVTGIDVSLRLFCISVISIRPKVARRSNFCFILLPLPAFLLLQHRQWSICCASGLARNINAKRV